MAGLFTHGGAQEKYQPNDTRRDVRRLDQRIQAALLSDKGVSTLCLVWWF